MSPHPSIKANTIALFKNKLDLPIYTSDLSTLELISIADLVVAGISVVCLESRFFGVDSIRLNNDFFPPQHDQSDGILTIENIEQFDEYLMAIDTTVRATPSIALEHFFYGLDGLAGKRLWDELRNLLK